MRFIRLLAVCLACLGLASCIEITNDNGYWAKAAADPALVGYWIKADQSDLVDIRRTTQDYLEAYADDGELIAHIKTLRTAQHNYILSRDKGDQTPTIMLVEYKLQGDKGTLYGVDTTNEEVAKRFFPDDKNASEYVRSLDILNDKTLGDIETMFANRTWLIVIGDYHRCDQTCVSTFKATNKKD